MYDIRFIEVIIYLSVQKVMHLKEEIKKARIEMRRKKDKAIGSVLNTLKPAQRLLVKECIAAAKVPKKGRRYNLQWIYECILMRTRSSSLYSHLRDNDLLPLPDPDTLHSYIKRMGSAYGFNQATFDLLEEKWKSGEFEESELRGSFVFLSTWNKCLDKYKVALIIFHEKLNASQVHF